MKFKLLFALALVLATGYSAVGFNCLDNSTYMDNFTINGVLMNTTGTCDYGCDTTINRCRTVDVGFGALVLGALMFFVFSMFYLAHYFRPKHEGEEGIDMGAVGLSFFFLWIGMLGIFAILFYLGGVGKPLVSTFIGGSVDWIVITYEIYGVILGAFLILFLVLYIKALLENFGGGEE